MGRQIIKKVKSALDLDVIEKEEKKAAKNFALKFEERYVQNEEYEMAEVVETTNRILTKAAETSRRLVNYIIEELRTRFPNIHKEYPFTITV